MNHGLHSNSRQQLGAWVGQQGQIWSWDCMDLLTSTQDYIARPGCRRARVYLVGQGGAGENGANTLGTGGASGGGGGMAFGDIPLGFGERLRVILTSTASSVGADFIANAGGAGAVGVAGAGGAASISSRVKNGGAYAGGAGAFAVAGDYPGSSGGSSGSPLGVGVAGIFGFGAPPSNIISGSGWGMTYIGARSIANRYTDILLALFMLCPDARGSDGSPGGFGGGASGNALSGSTYVAGYGGGGGGGNNSSTTGANIAIAPGGPAAVIFWSSK